MNASPAPAVPADRTIKQPVAWICRNPSCKPHDKPVLEFMNDYGICPRCKAEPPLTKLLALCHVLYPTADGPIVGMHGQRWAIACDPKRTYTATETNREGATNNTAVANCPGCITWLHSQGIDTLHPTILRPKRKGN
jgi:hypothetical protein